MKSIYLVPLLLFLAGCLNSITPSDSLPSIEQPLSLSTASENTISSRCEGDINGLQMVLYFAGDQERLRTEVLNPPDGFCSKLVIIDDGQYIYSYCPELTNYCDWLEMEPGDYSGPVTFDTLPEYDAKFTCEKVPLNNSMFKPDGIICGFKEYYSGENIG